MSRKDKVVSYFYDEEVGNFCYGGGNPMRPHRVRLTHSLVSNYGLTKQLLVHRPHPRNYDELTQFHADDYVDFLKTVTPDNQEEYMTQLRRFNMGVPGEADCPVFDGLYQYCQLYSGGSVDGAAMLADGKSDICLNWAGGMHHAKKAEASGFCYVNDIVLAILELLKVFPRVLYVDIDIHHGDGVEEAFYLTDRVMTVSFHKYGDFFPGTGALADVGYQKGKYYTVNVPLREGMDNESYRSMFEPILQKVMEVYQPNAIVVCGGADSLSGDRLGCFNLSLEGHSNCLEFLAKFNVPMLVLGGGGYTMRNVARCWCYETGRLMGVDLQDSIPDAALKEYDYYLDTHKLRIAVSNMKNANTRDELERIKRSVLENLAALPPVPSVQMAVLPPVKQQPDLPEEDPDVRGGGQAYSERRVVKREDDSDDEEVGPRWLQPEKPPPPPFGIRYVKKRVTYRPEAPAPQGVGSSMQEPAKAASMASGAAAAPGPPTAPPTRKADAGPGTAQMQVDGTPPPVLKSEPEAPTAPPRALDDTSKERPKLPTQRSSEPRPVVFPVKAPSSQPSAPAPAPALAHRPNIPPVLQHTSPAPAPPRVAPSANSAAAPEPIATAAAAAAPAPLGPASGSSGDSSGDTSSHGGSSDGSGSGGTPRSPTYTPRSPYVSGDTSSPPRWGSPISGEADVRHPSGSTGATSGPDDGTRSPEPGPAPGPSSGTAVRHTSSATPPAYSSSLPEKSSQPSSHEGNRTASKTPEPSPPQPPA